MKNLVKLLSVALVIVVLAAVALCVSGLDQEIVIRNEESAEASDASAEESVEPLNLKNFFTNGSFDTDLKGWSAQGVKWVDGKAVMTVNGQTSLAQSVKVVPGTTYTISGYVSEPSGSAMWNWLYGRIKAGTVQYDTIQISYNTTTGVFGKNADPETGYFEVEFKVPSDVSSIDFKFECSEAGFCVSFDDLFMTDGVTEVEEPTEPSTTSTTSKEEESKTEPQISEDESDTSETILPGDAIPDGVLDMKDVLAMRKIIAKMDVEGFNAANADFNGDGTLDMKDVLGLRKQLANIA